MKYYDWNPEKNQQLLQERGLCFEDIQLAIEEGRVLDTIEHPNKKKYAHQQILIVEIDDYAYLVPLIEDEEKYFFKTIIPSRKMTKHYLIQDKE